MAIDEYVDGIVQVLSDNERSSEDRITQDLGEMLKRRDPDFDLSAFNNAVDGEAERVTKSIDDIVEMYEDLGW